jgi:hypothetical protein
MQRLGTGDDAPRAEAPGVNRNGMGVLRLDAAFNQRGSTRVEVEYPLSGLR